VATNERVPAVMDPSGHWGPVVDSIQLGIRSGTNVFSLDRPIPLYLFERNVATNQVQVPNWAGTTGLILFVEDESGFVQKSVHVSEGYFGLTQLSGKLQIKCEINLNNGAFQLKPGIYKVRTLHEGFIRRETGEMFYRTNECSGILTIKITQQR